jgi:hypothetical protein
MMTKSFLFKNAVALIVFLLGISKTEAQHSSLNIGGGATTFLGDLGGKSSLGSNDPSDLDLRSIRYNVSLGLRLGLGNSFALRTALTYARVSADDKYTANLPRRTRNLSFFSPIAEGSIGLEYYIGQEKNLYVFGGIGAFYFNPKTRMGESVYTLRDYGTEGQYFLPGKTMYKPFAICIPFGVGYKILQGQDGSQLSLEFIFRKTTTDYMDDVSTVYVDKTQLAASNGAIAVALMDRTLADIPGLGTAGNIRGNPKNNDNYAFISFNYSIPLGAGSRVGQGFGGRYQGSHKRRKDVCPSRF